MATETLKVKPQYKYDNEIFNRIYKEPETPKDGFENAKVLINNLLKEKKTEFYEIKKENEQLKQIIEEMQKELSLVIPKIKEVYAFIKAEQQEYNIIDFEELKKNVKAHIVELKSKGQRTFSDFDLMEHFKAPIESIDKVLQDLEEEGLIDK